jgi:hypothetical protein
MGMDRGSRAGGSGGQNGYRRDTANGYRSGYGRESDGYADRGRDDRWENTDTSSSKYDKYESGGKYEQGSHHERGSHGSRRGADESSSGGRNNSGGGQNQPSIKGEMMPQAMIAALEKQISGAHACMTQALNEITGKENEKFDLIFGILIELQNRQAQLEESVQSLKSQLPPPQGGMVQQQIGGQQSQPAQGQPQQMNSQQYGGNSGSPQNFNQMGNQMGNQTNGQMFMPMNQQYGNMVSADGSQAFCMPMQNMQSVVVVQAPQGMQQMPQGMQMQYAMPQMMQPQMAMQYVNQDQSSNNFQWTGPTDAQQRTDGALEDNTTAQVDEEPATEDGHKKALSDDSKQAQPCPESGRELATKGGS